MVFATVSSRSSGPKHEFLYNRAPAQRHRRQIPTKPPTPQKSTDVQTASNHAADSPPHASQSPKSRLKLPVRRAVVAAFNALINGIRHADVKAVTSVYLNSPRLILFNSNGTVTKGWEQMRKNRESSYRDVKDVKLDVRDRFDHYARTRRRGGELSVDAVANLQGHARDCDGPNDSGFQARGQGLEGDSPAHFAGPTRSVARAAVRAVANSHHRHLNLIRRFADCRAARHCTQRLRLRQRSRG